MGFFEKHQVLRPNCNKCGLQKTCITPKMPYSGNGEKGILIISGAPTESEDESGIHFSGSSGAILHQNARIFGMDVQRDCWTVNAVNCRPLNKDGKSVDAKKYVDFCRPYLESTLQQLKPKKILLLGEDAVKAFYLGRENISLGESQGIRFWDSKYNAWVFPTFHPEHLLKFQKDRGLAMLFKKAVADVITQDIKPLQTKFVPYRKLIVFEEVIEFLNHVIQNEKLIALDYETTGSNVMVPGHKTVCVGIATPKLATSFLFEHPYYTIPQQKHIGKLLRIILKSRKIKKIVHNIQFEYVWSKYVIKQQMNSIIWDSMLAAHLVDNRQGITSLKYQAFQRWGIPDYSADIKAFLVPITGSYFNTVLKVPIDKLLEYNALDVVYTLALYYEQIEDLTEKEKEVAYPLFHKSAIIFSEMSYNGIKVDQELYEKERVKLSKERDSLIQTVTTSKEVCAFNKKFGGMFNMDSPPDMQKLLFDIMGLESKKQTNGGSNSVDADVLSKIDHPITRNVLKIRKLNKLIGTYIDGMQRLATDGFLHPQFMLHIARSYRSSGKDPNPQNFPKRDKLANKVVRSGMVPELNCVIGEGDLSGAEICTSCFPGDTKVETISGALPISVIVRKVQMGANVYVYGYSHAKRRVCVSKVVRGKCTGNNKELWRITLDNYEIVEVTPDHSFMLRDGSYSKVSDLVVGDSLMPLYKGVGAMNSSSEYTWVKTNNTDKGAKRYLWAHRMIAEDVLGMDPSSNLVCHHIDGDGTNNDISNIEVLTPSEHIKRHIVVNGNRGKDNPNYGNPMPQHVKDSIIKANTGRKPWCAGLKLGPLSEEHKKKIGNSIKGKLCPQRGRKGCTPWNKGKKTNLVISPKGKESISRCIKTYWENKENEVCAICGRSFKRVTNTHLIKHGLTLEEYKDKYNHKIIKIEKCVGYSDVFNIEVDDTHNYALAAGIIVKNCCFHRDPTFINYQMSENADMHRDAAAEIWKAEGLISKPVRQATKSGFVFAEFYGSYYVSCALKMWEEMLDLELSNGVPLREHIKIVGLDTYEKFEAHVKEFEHKFWYDWFPQYTQWKKDVFEQYIKNGYIETFFGFRFRGYMDRKQAANYPIQSTSFHILLTILIALDAELRKRGMKTKLISQIHDSIVAQIPVDELEEYKTILVSIVDNLINVYPWICVPIKAEIEISETYENGGSFASMTKVVG